MTNRYYLLINENYNNCAYFKEGNCKAIDNICYRQINNLSILGCKTRDVNLRVLEILARRSQVYNI